MNTYGLKKMITFSNILWVSTLLMSCISTTEVNRDALLLKDKEIESFTISAHRNESLTFGDVNATINHNSKKVSLEFIDVDEVNNLYPEWELSEGAKMYLKGKEINSGRTAFDFASSNNLTVVAENGTTNQYTIDVIKKPTLRVVTQEVICDDFLGVNGVYHGFCYMPANIETGMTDTDRDREFARVRAMGLNVARTWYSPDYTCGTKGSIYSEFDFNTAEIKAFCKWLEKMKEFDVDVALQAGWWFGNHPFYGSYPPNYESDKARYSEWVAESLKFFIEEKGFTNIKHLVLFTEPLNDGIAIYDKGDYKYPRGGRIEYYEDLCRAIKNKLAEENLLKYVKLQGPQTTGGGNDTPEFLEWAIDKLDDVIDTYTYHNYNGRRYQEGMWEYDAWQEYVVKGNKIMAKKGNTKPFWIDEYGHTNTAYRESADYGNYLAQCVAAFTNNGAQSSLIWLLFDQKYTFPQSNATNGDSFVNGVHRWGTTKWPHDTGDGIIPAVDNPTKPRASWYAFSMMSKYLGGRNGAKAYRTESLERDSVFVTAVMPRANELSIMVINGTHKQTQVNVTIDSSLNGRVLYRHLYDPNKLLIDESAIVPPVDKKIVDVETKFSDELPSRAVAIYTTLTN